MKKTLNTESIANELEGASLFFSKPVTDKQEHRSKITNHTPPPKTDRKKTLKTKTKTKKKEKKHETMKQRHRDTMPPRYHKTIIETVRRAVKDFGKEAATHRFTIDEKKAISDIIYTYKTQGVRTSENEIARIAVNYIVEDFKENGKSSVLDKVLKALND